MEVKINSRLFFMGLLCMLLTAAIILPLCTRAFYTQAVDNVEQACQLIAASYDAHPGEPDLSAFEEHDLRVTFTKIRPIRPPSAITRPARRSSRPSATARPR